MIKVSDLKKIIKLVLYSGYIISGKPLSIIMIGNVGIGKSEIIMEFKDTNNLSLFTDITYMGLLKLLKDNREVRHVVIPDFLKLTMKKGSTADNIISCLNSLIEEGLYEISLMGYNEDFKGKKAGLITATTKKSYEQHYKKWNAMGFLSRMIKVSFSYSAKTIEEIFNYIFKQEFLNETSEKIEMPFKNFDIKLDKKLAKKLRDKDTTFRSQKILQTLAQSHALIKGRKKVLLTDIHEVNRLKKYMNLEYNKI